MTSSLYDIIYITVICHEYYRMFPNKKYQNDREKCAQQDFQDYKNNTCDAINVRVFVNHHNNYTIETVGKRKLENFSNNR